MGENVKDRRAVKGIRYLLFIQLVTSVLISLGLLLVFGEREAISALLGGFVAIVPNVLFAKKLFRYRGARAARQIVKGFYVGEALKLFSTIVLFTLVFIYYRIAPLAFFLTYILVLMNHWFTPLIFDNKQNRPESD